MGGGTIVGRTRKKGLAMTHIDNFFDDKYLKAGHLNGTDLVLTISGVTQEEVGSNNDKRPVLSFEEIKKCLVLNKINSRRIIKLHGAHEEEWAGEKLTLYPSETDFSGETVDCVRVRKAGEITKKRAAKKPKKDLKT